jgi:hypothetical protein
VKFLNTLPPSANSAAFSFCAQGIGDGVRGFKSAMAAKEDEPAPTQTDVASDQAERR